jgi:hypothetical protein
MFICKYTLFDRFFDKLGYKKFTIIYVCATGDFFFGNIIIYITKKGSLA